MGPSIKYVRKIVQKTNISTYVCVSGGLEMLVFRKILRTYLMDDPKDVSYIFTLCEKTYVLASKFTNWRKWHILWYDKKLFYSCISMLALRVFSLQRSIDGE